MQKITISRDGTEVGVYERNDLVELVEIGEVKSFPIHKDDNWYAFFEEGGAREEQVTSSLPLTSFREHLLIRNPSALSSQLVWVLGDSFSSALKPYLNKTFKEVRYLGHWKDHLEHLASNLRVSRVKPDLILIVRVERSF